MSNGLVVGLWLAILVITRTPQAVLGSHVVQCWLVTIGTRFGDRRYLPGNARSDLYNCVFCAYVGGDVSQTAEPYARVSPCS